MDLSQCRQNKVAVVVRESVMFRDDGGGGVTTLWHPVNCDAWCLRLQRLYQPALEMSVDERESMITRSLNDYK